MANEEHVAILRQGFEVWNQWRKKNPHVNPDLSHVDLPRADLSRTDLRYADLRYANLAHADLSHADLHESYLASANLSNANFHSANLVRADLRYSVLSDADLTHADLSSSNLSDTVLRWTNLYEVNLNAALLRNADLREANLNAAQALSTHFGRANFTGTCLEDWNINSVTLLRGSICEYVYLKYMGGVFGDRRPSSGTFKVGEFETLFQKAVETIDLIFSSGIDWKAFFISFQELREKYDDENLTIQGIEKKRGGAFVVRLEVPPQVDKAGVERQAKELYETQLILVEQRYRAELNAKDQEISIYRQHSADLFEIVKLQASRSINVEAKAVVEKDTNTANFDVDTLNSGAINTGSGSISDVTQNITNTEAKQTLAEAAAEIQTLLKQLEQTAPAESMSEKMALATQAIAQIESNPTLKQRAVAALSAGGLKAFEAAIDHPVAAFVVGRLRGGKTLSKRRTEENRSLTE